MKYNKAFFVALIIVVATAIMIVFLVKSAHASEENTPLPEVSCTPTVEPSHAVDKSPTEEITASPSAKPKDNEKGEEKNEKKGDGKSDGRHTGGDGLSDGKSSCPECTKNHTPLAPPSTGKAD